MFLTMRIWEDAKGPKLELLFQEKKPCETFFLKGVARLQDSLQPLGISIEQKTYQNFNTLYPPWSPKNLGMGKDISI